MSSGIVFVLPMLIATLSGWLLSRHKTEKPVKVMLFVLYFWAVVFVQLIVFAVFYQLGWLEGLLSL